MCGALPKRWALWLHLGALVVGDAPALRPNIVFIMADDLGYGEVGAFPAASPHGRIATPRLDALAASGLRFTRSYAGYTVCAPSRTVLLTGVHAGHFAARGFGGQSLAPGQALTVADVLRGAGYATALVGKAAPLADPARSGFDAFLVGQVDQTACHDMYPKFVDSGPRPASDGPRGWGNVALRNEKPSRAACMADPTRFDYATDVYANAAAAYLEKTRATPFFLYVSFTTPHAGGWGTNDESGNPTPTTYDYDPARAWPDVERDHAGAIGYLDARVGAVVDRVDARHAKNTVVIFASDNGAHAEGGHNVSFFDSTGGLRGFKRSLYEGGVRSPTVVRWRGVVAPGTTSAFPWSFADFLATAADLAGAPPPNGTDGASIASALAGGPPPERSAPLFFTWVGDAVDPPRILATGYAAVLDDFKVVNRHCHGRPSDDDALALYDLAADPAETADVAAAHPAIVAAFRRAFAADPALTCACYQC